jgi:predicted glycogen debranching enzyme
MDACLDGKSVIPRYGYLVEINALWYNAVAFVEELGLRFHDPITTKATELRERIEETYTKTFFNEEKGYLADYVRDGMQNLQIRPNQILAISLPYSPVNDEIAVKVLAVVIEELFTPVGLRTLSPQDADYCGIYEGGTYSRDRAYHNGTVWPWLIGPLGDALFKLNDSKSKAKKQLRAIVDGFSKIIDEAGIGSISEIYDGDAPHKSRGCIAQAWSVAEVRRLAIISAK